METLLDVTLTESVLLKVNKKVWKFQTHIKVLSSELLSWKLFSRFLQAILMDRCQITRRLPTCHDIKLKFVAWSPFVVFQQFFSQSCTLSITFPQELKASACTCFFSLSIPPHKHTYSCFLHLILNKELLVDLYQWKWSSWGATGKEFPEAQMGG